MFTTEDAHIMTTSAFSLTHRSSHLLTTMMGATIDLQKQASRSCHRLRTSFVSPLDALQFCCSAQTV
jgi:hypothetical protein